MNYGVHSNDDEVDELVDVENLSQTKSVSRQVGVSQLLWFT